MTLALCEAAKRERDGGRKKGEAYMRERERQRLREKDTETEMLNTPGRASSLIILIT